MVLGGNNKDKNQKESRLAIEEKVIKKIKPKPLEIKTKTTINENLKDLL